MARSNFQEIAAPLRMFVNLDLHGEAGAGVRAFLLESADGEITFTNSLNERYTLRRSWGAYTLGFPLADYSGDPAVARAFNDYVK